MPAARRPGFTLIELMVVLAILVVVVAMLLPAVQRVRESANRTACQNNLRQVGQAVLQYEGATRHYPPAGVSTAMPQLGVPAGVQHGWAVWLLPHLDQGPLRAKYNVAKDWRDAANKEAREAVLPVFRCRSVPIPGGRILSTSQSGFGTVKAAASDYTVVTGFQNAGKDLADGGYIDLPAAPQAALQVNALTRVEDITDGLATTFLVQEMAGAPQLWRNGKMVDAGGADENAWASRDANIVLHGFNEAGTATPGPCHTSCQNSHEVYSFHWNGADHVFADGLSKFVRSAMDIRLFARLITRAGRDAAPPLD